MTETLPEDIKVREDHTNRITFKIYREADSQDIKIYLRAPLAAEIIEKMAQGNYDAASFDKVYTSILSLIPEKKSLAVTRPAIGKVTKNIVSAADWSWDAPRAVLLANPAALRDGYTLTIKVTEPIVPDVMREWGSKLVRGLKDIVANARPFTMHWTMDETPIL